MTEAEDRIQSEKRECFAHVVKVLNAKPDLFTSNGTGDDGAKGLIDAAEKLREYLYSEAIKA